MLAAIRELGESRPDEQREHLAVLEYLEACSFIFENGILSSNPITCSSSQAYKNIEKGFQFFFNWKIGMSGDVKYLIVHAYTIIMFLHFLEKNLRSPHQKCFLAWQVRKLLNGNH